MDRGDARLNGPGGAAWLNSTGMTGHLHPTIPYTLLSVLRHLSPKTQPAPGPASAGTRGGTSKVSRTLNLGNPWYLLQDHFVDGNQCLLLNSQPQRMQCVWGNRRIHLVGFSWLQGPSRVTLLLDSRVPRVEGDILPNCGAPSCCSWAPPLGESWDCFPS